MAKSTNFYLKRSKELPKDSQEQQKKAFTKWLNSYSIFVSDIYEDLCDGKKLAQLLEALTGESVGKLNSGRLRIEKVENVRKCFNFLHNKITCIEMISTEDIVDGDPRLILSLLWAIIQRFEFDFAIDEPKKKPKFGSFWRTRISAKRQLLKLCQLKTKGYPNVLIRDFAESWRNGLGFNALIHAYRPDLINFESLVSFLNVENIQNAFDVGAKRLSIPNLLDIEDVDCDKPDEKLIMLYVASCLKILDLSLKPHPACNRLGLQELGCFSISAAPVSGTRNTTDEKSHSVDEDTRNPVICSFKSEKGLLTPTNSPDSKMGKEFSYSSLQHALNISRRYSSMRYTSNPSKYLESGIFPRRTCSFEGYDQDHQKQNDKETSDIPYSVGGNIEAVDFQINETPLEVDVVKPYIVFDYPDDHYKLPRDGIKGYALILNNIKFENGVRNRIGAKHDTEYMSQLWTQLGYEVTVKNQFFSYDFPQILNEFKSKFAANPNASSSILFVGSHGFFSKIETADHQVIDLYQNIVYEFNHEKCPQLKGKPKIFIVQACQRFMTDDIATATNINGADTMLRQPIADTIICSSTIPGYLSNRDTFLGTWYAYCMSKVFMENAHYLDLEAMLKQVQRTLRKVVEPAAEAQVSTYIPFDFEKLYFNLSP